MKIRSFLAKKPILFSWLRKIIELNFKKQKRIITEVFKLNGNYKILDIGCGTGEFAGLFNKIEYCGIDISNKYIDYASQKEKGNFKVMDATNLKLKDKSFDYILIMAIFHHLNDNEVSKVLSEAKRVLKPNGKILILENAKVENLENLVVKFIQRFDKGNFIRTPNEYKSIVSNFFSITHEYSFRSGGCNYYSLSVKNNHGSKY